MRTNRKKNIKLAVLSLILLLGLGFAALAANLKIDGTVNVAKTSWDVHFENVSITEGSVEANPAPTSNNTDTTEMNYTINFSQPGDYFEFTVDIVNDGTIDAMIESVTNNAYANASSTTPIAIPAYLSSSVTYDDGTPIQQKQELLHNTSEKIKVRVEFKKDINISDLPSSGDTSIVFKFKGDYKQADENAISTYDWRLPEGRTKDNLQVGDEICTRDQCFNFLHYDGTNDEDIVMLAKYNLKVGDIRENYSKIGEYTSNDSGYGLQSSEVRGADENAGPGKWSGTVVFSATSYWMSGDNLLSPYNQNDTIYLSRYGEFRYRSDDSIVQPTIYDPINYKGAPETQTYSVAYYVEEYKSKLVNDYHTTIKEARLLTYYEATDPSIGCVELSRACSTNGFIKNTSFWLGSAGDTEPSSENNIGVWAILYDGRLDFNISGDGYKASSYYGVRPVVIIEKDSI